MEHTIMQGSVLITCDQAKIRKKLVMNKYLLINSVIKEKLFVTLGQAKMTPITLSMKEKKLINWSYQKQEYLLFKTHC